jgi:hypothetical protein
VGVDELSDLKREAKERREICREGRFGGRERCCGGGGERGCERVGMTRVMLQSEKTISKILFPESPNHILGHGKN